MSADQVPRSGFSEARKTGAADRSPGAGVKLGLSCQRRSKIGQEPGPVRGGGALGGAARRLGEGGGASAVC